MVHVQTRRPRRKGSRGRYALDLDLVDPEEALIPMTRDVAWTIARDFPLNTLFVNARMACGQACCTNGPSHGPYWRASFKRGLAGRVSSKYLGATDERVLTIRRAHGIVKAEIEALEEKLRPEMTRLAEMRAAVYAEKRPRTKRKTKSEETAPEAPFIAETRLASGDR